MINKQVICQLFYGGIELINFDYNNRIDVVEMMDEYKNMITVDMFKRVCDIKEYSSITYQSEYNDNIDCIKLLNI